MTSPEPEARRRVFLSFVHDDQALAQGIEQALAQYGVQTTNQVLEVTPGGDLTAQLRDNVRLNDVVVLLLSPAESRLRRGDDEIMVALSRDLARRGADLIPVLTAPTDLRPLASSLVVDLTSNAPEGLRQLADQIQAVSRADFSAMSPFAFDNLVGDLLRASGFSVEERRRRGYDEGWDLRATYERSDPFGTPETEVWLVQTKLYSRERVSVQTVRELAGVIAVAPGGTRGLLVTNAQLTSVAQGLVVDLEQRSRVRLRVLDGVELRLLLRRFPSVAARHFGDPTAERESGADS
jgi:hypothetical protein